MKRPARDFRWIRCASAMVASLAAASAMAARPIPQFALDPNPSTYQPLPRTDTLIVGATVLDGAGRRIDNGEVLIRDGKIAAIGQGLERSNVSVIDAKGRWVTPGIIDVHSHDGTYALPSTSIDIKTSDVSEISEPNVADTWIEHAANAQDPAFSAALRGGVTTLQILPGSGPLIGGRSVVVKPVPATNIIAMKFPGAPQGLKMSCGENPKTNFGEKDKAPTSRQGEIAMLRTAFLRAQEYRNDWIAYAKGSRKEPPPRDLKLDTLVAVLDGDIPVHQHCYRSSDMVAMLGVAREFGFHIAAFHHATDAYKIAARIEGGGYLRCGLVRLVGIQDGGPRRHSRKCRDRGCRRWLRPHALGFAGRWPAAQYRGREGSCRRAEHWIEPGAGAHHPLGHQHACEDVGIGRPYRHDRSRIQC